LLKICYININIV